MSRPHQMLAELRIGNWIENYIFYSDNFQHGPKSIKQVMVDFEIFKFLSEHEFATYRGVELTEEILSRCGFIPIDDDGLFEYNFIQLQDRYLANDGFCFSFGRHYLVNLKYLHQLQNLYYALTETELNYKANG